MCDVVVGRTAAVPVPGTGAVAVPVPPVGVLYHKRPLPVAVSATAVAFWQYTTGVVTTGAAGAAGAAFTVTGIVEVQPAAFFTVIV